MSEERPHCSPPHQTSSGNLLREVGQLVRTTSTPHTPIWITGANYPAQYLIRQTRSMTARFTTMEQTLVISIPLNKIVLPTRRRLLPVLSLPVETLDFYLPDKIFLKLKLQKLKQVEESQKISQRRVTPQDEEHVSYSVYSQPDTSSKSNSINIEYLLDDISGNLSKTTSSLQTGTEFIIPSVWFFPDHDTSHKITCRIIHKDGLHMNSMIYMGCILLHKKEEEDHNNIGWFIDNSGNHILLVTSHSLCIYKVIIDGVDLMYNVKHGEHVLENIFCLQLLYKETDEVLFAVIGSRECICWVFQLNKTPYRLSLYSKDDNNVVGLCDIWTNNDDVIMTYTCTFPVASLWCCILNSASSECQWIISKQYKLPLDKALPIHCLCHINETSYIVGVVSIYLFIWDCLSASLLKRVQLQCSPDKGVEPSLPMVLTAFIEDKVHLFLVVCTNTCSCSCCWLILVTMTIHECVGEPSPYMVKLSGQDLLGGAHLSQLVMTYMLPSNTNERVIHYRIASSKQLGASLSNNDIILWDLLQSHPVAKILLSGIKMDSFAWPQNNKLWIVSNNCLHLFKKNDKI